MFDRSPPVRPTARRSLRPNAINSATDRLIRFATIPAQRQAGGGWLITPGPLFAAPTDGPAPRRDGPFERPLLIARPSSTRKAALSDTPTINKEFSRPAFTQFQRGLRRPAVAPQKVCRPPRLRRAPTRAILGARSLLAPTHPWV
jgi:hypothetical protein